MRSSIQVSRPSLLRWSVLRVNEPSRTSIVPSRRALLRAKHSIAKGRVPRVSQAQRKLPPELREQHIFLRDACSCPRCVHISTSQKLFETADIPLDIKVNRTSFTRDGDIRVSWKNDIPGYKRHISTYTESSFTQYRGVDGRIRATPTSMTQTPWDRTMIESKNLILDYDSYMNSPTTLLTALRHLHNYGLFFIASVPSDLASISTIATRIGPLQNTFYGPVWDVRSVPSAKNVAYTSGHLGFHMDLLYMADPPKVQILHCLKASTRGGESLFSDALAAVLAMLPKDKDNDKRLLTSLFQLPVTYRYKNDGQWYQYTRPTLETNFIYPYEKFQPLAGKIAAINWSPPFQAPFEIDVEQAKLTNYLKMAKQFKALVESDAAVFETRMTEGTCVVFDNRRVLHARKAFSSKKGVRWLRGAYVSGDAFMSRLRMLNEEYGAAEDEDAEAEVEYGAAEDVEAQVEATV